MTAYGYARGHRIEFDEAAQVWRYADTGEVFDHERPCTLCHEMPTPEGCDACLGELPGALNACCGHGVEEGYISYVSGETAVLIPGVIGLGKPIN